VFGSVICAVELFFRPLRPLWQAARETNSASAISRADIPICFRIENNARAKEGCKPVFDQREKENKLKPESVAYVFLALTRKRD
jgi:hypothetical protein